jgi:hypothetical protein
MKPHRLLPLIPALFAAAFLAGCTDNKFVGPGGPLPPDLTASIELRIDHYPAGGFRGLAGEVRSLTISAIARNAYGVAIERPSLAWSIDEPAIWKGTITALDSSGSALYQVVLSRSGDVVIRATSGNVTASTMISLEVIGPLAHFTLDAPGVVIVPPDSTRQFDVIASCTDSDGIGIPGILCRFEVQPDSLGTVSPDSAITDFNGQAKTTFSTIMGRYGTCTVTVAVGDIVATAEIEIVEESRPAHIIILCDSASIEVPPGVNGTIDYVIVVTDGRGHGMFNVPVSVWLAEYLPGSGTFGTIEFRFYSLGGYGREYIVARVDGMDEEISDSLLITVSRPAPPIGRITAWANPDHLEISADSLGKSIISAYCVDLQNVAIPNVLVEFSTNLGRLWHRTVTVSTGVATAEFYILPRTDFPSPDSTEATATITATVGDFTATAEIEIVEESRPAYLDFFLGQWHYPVPPDSDATIDIFVLVFDDHRVLLPDVRVEMWLSRYAPDSGIFGRIVRRGSSWFTFHTDGGFGKEYIVARAGEGDDAIEDSLLFFIRRPHQPFGRLAVSAVPSSLSISLDTLGRAMIYAHLQDSSGVGVPNWEVEFWTDIGWLARPTLTDSDGTATAEFYILPRTDFPSPDSTEVTATITATIPNSGLSDSVQVRVLIVE